METVKRRKRWGIAGLVIAAFAGALAPALPARAGAIDHSPDEAIAADAGAGAVADLTAFMQKARIEAGLPPLVVRDVLARLAAARAAGLAAGTRPPDADAALVAQLYIPFQVVVLEARAGDDPTQAWGVWMADPATAGAVTTPGLSEVGVARLANPAAAGPNDAYIWEAVLAQPLTTPAESPDSPRAKDGGPG